MQLEGEDAQGHAQGQCIPFKERKSLADGRVGVVWYAQHVKRYADEGLLQTIKYAIKMNKFSAYRCV
jgi:hypothetical protein